MSRWYQRVGALFHPRRTSGRPASPNGASSFHLWWQMPDRPPLVEVSAVLEVVTPPAVDRLYFWALQVDFVDGAAHRGGGHTGLQWNRRHPGGTAVNWGGYAAQREGGGELFGSPSSLPGFVDDANTRTYPWQPGRPYRLTVWPAPERPGWWRAEIADVEAGRTDVIRDLHGGGTRLASPLVWSEVFAHCDDPAVEVRWSELRAVDETGAVVTPDAVRVNYQAHRDGGCTNTSTFVAADGVHQATSTPRETPQGAVLSL